MNFSDIQNKIINHNKGAALVVAGPGSGKTAVTVARTVNLISKYKVEPNNITVITFTRNAAQEMKNRFLQSVCGKNLREDCAQVNFSTIHALAYEVINYCKAEKTEIVSYREKKNIIERGVRILKTKGSNLNIGRKTIEMFDGEIARFTNYLVNNCNVYDNSDSRIKI